MRVNHTKLPDTQITAFRRAQMPPQRAHHLRNQGNKGFGQ